MRPNIVLLILDTARADAFEPYGAASGASPTVAGLASAGRAVDAYSTASWTLPAHLSLFTGHLPRAAGFRPAGSIRGYKPLLEGLAPHLLPSVLSRAGYQTVGLSTNTWISPVTGFDAGFDEFVFVRGWRTRKLAATKWRTRLAWYREALRSTIDDGAVELESRLAEWLASPHRRPFFWFVNLVECHSPYLPPKPYNDLPAIGRMRAARDARRHLTLSEIWKCSVGGFDLADDVVARMRHLYAGSIRQLDDWLARLLDMLDRHGVLDSTQLLVTSDHGENLGDGEMLGHAFSLDDRLLRVPLVISGPHAPPDGGLTSLSSIPGYLADVAGLEDHPFPEVEREEVVVAEFDAPLDPTDERVQRSIERWGMQGVAAEEAARRLTTSFSCASDGSFKLVRRLGREELFDLERDPIETQPALVTPDVERDHGDRLSPLRRALDRAETGGQGPVTGPTSPAGEPVDGLGASDEETAEIEAQLRLLGYL